MTNSPNHISDFRVFIDRSLELNDIFTDEPTEDGMQASASLMLPEEFVAGSINRNTGLQPYTVTVAKASNMAVRQIHLEPGEGVDDYSTTYSLHEATGQITGVILHEGSPLPVTPDPEHIRQTLGRLTFGVLYRSLED